MHQKFFELKYGIQGKFGEDWFKLKEKMCFDWNILFFMFLVCASTRNLLRPLTLIVYISKFTWNIYKRLKNFWQHIQKFTKKLSWKNKVDPSYAFKFQSWNNLFISKKSSKFSSKFFFNLYTPNVLVIRTQSRRCVKIKMSCSIKKQLKLINSTKTTSFVRLYF